MLKNLMMLRLSPLLLALLIAALAGCASISRQPPSFASLGQFEQYQLNTAIFRIRFVGDPNMSPGVAEEIALLKAAKTALDHDYRYFYVLSETKTPKLRRTVVYPGSFAGSPWYGPYHSRWPHYGWGWNDPFYDSVVYNVDPVEISYTIKCSTTPSAQHEEFDARLIMASLGSKYYLNPDGSPRVMTPENNQVPSP
ncbi:hypothetical protein ACF3NA_10220 [Alkanindiges sp. WGS2144]|uniref:CC0125/CC1285 family lipoprotein n=1 Tax=Alkanindiges sp. WGS2144 TaxID=3366808 RepID=UPI0037514896